MSDRSLAKALVRGLRKRCPNCGGASIFRSWGSLKEICPSCGYGFEREEGYWVGALVINIAVAEVLFGILFVATLALTLPEVPWAPLLIVALVTNGLVPLAFYPRSKTLWMAIDVYAHPPG